jgi:hypothetical protein
VLKIEIELVFPYINLKEVLLIHKVVLIAKNNLWILDHHLDLNYNKIGWNILNHFNHLMIKKEH